MIRIDKVWMILDVNLEKELSASNPQLKRRDRMFNKKTYAGLVADHNKNETPVNSDKKVEHNATASDVLQDAPISPSGSAVSAAMSLWAVVLVGSSVVILIMIKD